MRRWEAHIHWERVLWSVLATSLFACAGILIWYWVAVWLPQKESEAMRLHLDQMAIRYWAEVRAERASGQ